MTLSYIGSIAMSATPAASCYDTNANLLYTVDSTPAFKKWNLTTLAQSGTNATCVTSPSGICMLNSASAAITSTGSSSVNLVQVSTGFVQSYGSGTSTTPFSTQAIASDQGLGVALYLTTTANTLGRIVASTFTFNSVLYNETYFPSVNETFSCIISKGSGTGRFLVGGKLGKIYEVDQSGVVYNSLTVQPVPNNGQIPIGGSVSDFIYVTQLALEGNILLVSTTNTLYTFDYSTGQQLSTAQFGVNSGTSFYSSFSNAASGEVIFGRASTTNDTNSIYEMDFTVGTPNPISVRDALFTASTGGIVSCGINNTTAWALQSSVNSIVVFTITPRASTTRPVTVTVGGVNVQCRVTLLDDTGGVGTAFTILDTFIQSPGTYRVPTGRTLREIIRYSHGVQAYWDETSYST